MRFRAYLAWLGVVWVLGGAPARASECAPPSGISPCLDANALWIGSGDARLFSLSSGTALGAGEVGLSVTLQALWRPLRLNVPSSNAAGREVEFVAGALEQDTTIAIGLGHHLELGLGLPLVLRQSGAGSEGLSSQDGASIDRSGERDPRVSLAWALEVGSFKLKPRLGLSLPFGNREGYLSAGSVVAAPAIPVALKYWRFESVVELGLRLRSGVDLGGVRMGSQASLGLGVSFEVLQRELLLLGAEAFLQPSLVDNRSARAPSSVDVSLLAAEYVVSVRSRPTNGDWSVALGAGSALALARESSSAGETRFVAPPGPSLRVLSELRYAPR
ncbi:MAG: hypothetical protein QM756_30210 [Polyangiaceae bacterium]